MTLNALYTIMIVTCLIHFAKLQDPADGDSGPPYQQAAVATDVSQCSTMSKDILRQGGSAVDAAITAALCIGVVNPQSSGLGGGFSMVVYTHQTREAEALIATEMAPGAATEDMFPDQASSGYEIESIAVPGEVLGFWEAHKKYGKLPWAALFCPVIQIAEEGFQVTTHLPFVLKKLDIVTDFPWIREMYRPDDGRELKAGDTLRSPRELVDTLKKIAIYGPGVFYNGSVTRDILQDMKEKGGIFTPEDFSAFKVEWLPVSYTSFKNGLQMYSTPLPSSGPTLQFILSILDEFDITDEDFASDERKLLLYHRFLEAGKFAFALRFHLGDEPESELVQTILSAIASKHFAKETASLINDTHVTHSTQFGYDISDDISKMMGDCNHVVTDAEGDAAGDTVHINVEAENGDAVSVRDEEGDSGDTAQISVLAENGDAVSVTHSVGRYFGSKFYSKRTGIWFNSHMSVFYFPSSYNASTCIWKWPGAANSIAPFKRFMAYVSPSIITDVNGNVKLLVGAAGAPRITPTNAWVILRTLWMGSSLKEAIDEKRIYNYLIGNKSTYYEPGFPQELLDALNAMGHYPQVRKTPYNFAVPNAILRLNDGLLNAYSDLRKGGYADGY